MLFVKCVYYLSVISIITSAVIINGLVDKAYLTLNVVIVNEVIKEIGREDKFLINRLNTKLYHLSN